MDKTLIYLPGDLTPSPTSGSVNDIIAAATNVSSIFTSSKLPIHVPNLYEFSNFSSEVNETSYWAILSPPVEIQSEMEPLAIKSSLNYPTKCFSYSPTITHINRYQISTSQINLCSRRFSCFGILRSDLNHLLHLRYEILLFSQIWIVFRHDFF